MTDDDIPTFAQERFQQAYDLLPMGIVIVDAKGFIVLVNHGLERLLGYDRSELLGQSIECLVPKNLEQRHRAARHDYDRQAVARPMGVGRELMARHRDGHEIPVEIGLSPINHGEKRFVVSTIVDVSERRQLEEKVQQVQKETTIGNLAAGIAHDFNNILLGILGYTELARELQPINPETESHLDDIMNIAQRGRDLVGRILNFARKKEPVRRPIGWERIISDSIRLMRVSLPANVSVHLQPGHDVPDVWADPTELQQTFINLLTNAIHASARKGGAIQVRLDKRQFDGEVATQQSNDRNRQCVCLSIIDEGEGMSPRVLAHLFEPFFTTKPPGKGTGLGLSVTRRIVNALGGTVSVQSQEGRGTRIDVCLPVASGDGSDGELAPKSPLDGGEHCLS